MVYIGPSILSFFFWTPGLGLYIIIPVTDNMIKVMFISNDDLARADGIKRNKK
jgi:hypothetical protein